MGAPYRLTGVSAVVTAGLDQPPVNRRTPAPRKILGILNAYERQRYQQA